MSLIAPSLSKMYLKIFTMPSLTNCIFIRKNACHQLYTAKFFQNLLEEIHTSKSIYLLVDNWKNFFRVYSRSQFRWTEFHYWKIEFRAVKSAKFILLIKKWMLLIASSQVRKKCIWRNLRDQVYQNAILW